MFTARSVLMFALLPLFAGCQLLPSQSADNKVSTAGMIRNLYRFLAATGPQPA